MSPNSEPSDVLLARYVAGECTAAECREIEARFGLLPSIRRRVEDLGLVIGFEPAPGEWDTDAMWTQVRARTVDADSGRGERASAQRRWPAPRVGAGGSRPAFALIGESGGSSMCRPRLRSSSSSPVPSR